MQSTVSDPKSSVDLVCPHCGVSAFEIISEPIEDSGGKSDPALVMRCFGCDHVYQHVLENALDTAANKPD